MNSLDKKLIAPAAVIMTRYRMSIEDQVEVMCILVDAGIETCLNEQQRIVDEKNSIISQAQQSYRGLVH